MTHLAHPVAALTLLAGLALVTTPAAAEQCFASEQSLNVDAQSIRQKALGMGWTVGKTASFPAAGLVSSKAVILNSSVNPIREPTEGQTSREAMGLAAWPR